MFVAAFDNRLVTPEYVFSFISNTLKFCDLNYISPAKDLANSERLDVETLRHSLRTIDPASLPLYQQTSQLFDDLYVNYSTNPDSFERPCFHRWFALNAATVTLSDNDYICLLDTDFMIGMSPSDVLGRCLLNSDNKNIHMAADWQYVSRADHEIPPQWIPYICPDKNYPNHISPHITIMTKFFLHDFCKFILTDFYSPESRKFFIGYYFDLIGKGLYGGICDMTAIASYSMLRHNKQTFNLKNESSLEIIGNFNSFLSSYEGKANNWKINFRPNGQTLQMDNKAKQLIGVHFQGDAKIFMPLVNTESRKDGEITRAACEEYMETLARNRAIRAQKESLAIAHAAQPIAYRFINRLRREISILFQRSE